MVSTLPRSSDKCPKDGWSNGPGRRLIPVTRQPSRSRRSTIAAPIPELAPVTSACLSITSALLHPSLAHPHIFDRAAMEREGHVDRAVRGLLDGRIGQLAVGLVA